MVSGETIFVLSNLKGSAINYTVPAAFANSTMTDVINGGTKALGTQITLQPYSYFVLKQ